MAVAMEVAVEVTVEENKLPKTFIAPFSIFFNP